MDKAPILKRSALAAAGALALAVGGAQHSAVAQIQGEGGPIAVSANALTYEGNVAVYSGAPAVEAIQGQTRLRCSVLRITFRQSQGPGGALSSGGAPERYDCSGPVYYVTPTEQAKGDAAVFTAANDTIVLTGNVTVQQGQNVAQGHRLTINTRTRATRLESTASDRVRTVIYPDETGGPSAE